MGASTLLLVNRLLPLMTGDHGTTSQSGRKAVLFCPACGYDAPLDADWDVTKPSREGRTNIACAECGAVVVSQPAFEHDDGSLLRPVTDLINSVVGGGVTSD
jgi:hypothetical protein